MMELYEGDIAIDCRSEEINHIIRRYRSRFLEIAEKMIGILNESESYSEIRHVAEKGLQIEACNPVMYFWLIVCSHKSGMITTEKEYLKKAKENLIEQEYEEMIERLGQYGVKCR